MNSRIDSLLRQTRPKPLSTTPLSSGLSAFDALLPEGIPAGQLTEFVGPDSSGKTSLLHRIIMRTQTRGTSVGYVDAERSLMPADWCTSAPGLLWVVRPPRPTEGAFCIEVLLRSCSFGLVILDGGPPLAPRLATRLQRMARHSAAALLLVRHGQRSSIRVAERIRFAGRPSVDGARVLMVREKNGPTTGVEACFTQRSWSSCTVHASGADRPQARSRVGARYGR